MDNDKWKMINNNLVFNMKTFNKRAHIILAIAVVYVFNVIKIFAAAYGSYTILPESRVWLDGSSNVNEFSCGTNHVFGNGYLDSVPKVIDAAFKKTQEYSIKAEFGVNVVTLDCGNNMMNSDMYKALKYKNYPDISYKLISARMQDGNNKNIADAKIKVNALGYLTVGGATRIVEITVDVTKLSNEMYRIRGSKKVSMKDFGIAPPTAFLGLVKARDAIEVNFDIVTRLSVVD